MDPDLNWVKILDPDPNSMYVDPQHWFFLSLSLPDGETLETLGTEIAVGTDEQVVGVTLKNKKQTVKQRNPQEFFRRDGRENS